ncbi:MAG: phospho-sugar mutase [Peptococcaceae bacterium]
MNFFEEYKKWCGFKGLADDLKQELTAIADNEAGIKERFYKSLEFGTGGLRGIIGAGTNRMNIYTVRKASQGLAEYIKKNGSQKKDSVVIAYDSRINSRLFAEQAAQVLANNNIKSWLFAEIIPTPVLSFAVRELGCTAGIVITASHNPREYNGYKVYWSDGGQITDTIANGILAEIEQIADELRLATLDLAVGLEQSLIAYVPEKLFDKYIEEVGRLSLQPEMIRAMAERVKIVYTPLHGTGNIPVRRVLAERGFKNINIVEEQVVPDGSFPTVKYPNPEDPAALKMALDLGHKVKADIIMATDPDADRLGIAVKDQNNNYQMLTGNQLGALLLDYILTVKNRQGLLQGNEVLVKTIVTSEFGRKIAEKFKVETRDVLTGFKYIGEKIKEFTASNQQKFIFGYEESYGYLIGDFVRDKDAVQACLLSAEMAAYYTYLGKDLATRLQELYEEFGFFQEELMSYHFQGAAGQDKIKRIMKYFRDHYPKTIGALKVVVVSDYYLREEINILSGLTGKTSLPRADVIQLKFDDGSWVCIRPSGTEPKLKIYLGVVSQSPQISEAKTKDMKNILQGIIEKIR